MSRIIITGATSMIGVALIEAAIAKGIEVYAIVRPNTRRLNRIISSQLVHILYGTLESLLDVNGLPDDADVFYHLAWAGTNKSDRDNPVIHERNIRYTLNAVELAFKCGCRRFIGAGSQAEYGPVEGIINECTKYNPISSYGISKYAAAILSKKMCCDKGIEHIWARVFSIYGPHDNEGTLLDYAIKSFDKGEIAYFSSGIQMWNYLYEKDAGEMFYRLGSVNVPVGEYFIANDRSKPLREYIDILMKTYGKYAECEFASISDDKVYGLEVDVERTMRTLDYRPQTSFEDGIRKMIDYRTSKIKR